MFSRHVKVSKGIRNLRKDVAVEIFPKLYTSIPSWLVQHCSFWFCCWCFNIEKDPPSSFRVLCPKCRRRMKQQGLRWGSKIRVYHTRYIINRKTRKAYTRRGRKLCTPIKKVFDGRIYHFADHITSRVHDWESSNKKKQ